MSIVARVKRLCDINGITIAELERNAGIGNGVIRRWDDRAPASDKLADTAKYFGVTVDYLLGLSEMESAAASSTTSYDDLPPEAIQELNNYREFLKQKYGKK